MSDLFLIYRGPSPHMGTDFIPEGGKNVSKSEVPPKMAVGEG